jgi:uncharacterized SAM-binding protein YcdF (DUF218 family)
MTHGYASSQRWVRARDALVGAAYGVLVAAAVIGSEVPRVTAGYPRVFVLVCAAVGAALTVTHQHRRAAFLVVPIAALAAVVMVTPIMSPLVKAWIRNDPIPVNGVDAIVVLSAGMHADGALNAPAAERLVKGIELVRARRAPMLITTRITFPLGGRTVDSDGAQRRLVRAFADSVDWRIIGPVGVTRDEALRAKELLDPLGKRRVAVVTSPLHARRACATFEAVGFQVWCVVSEEWTYSVGLPIGPADRIQALFDYVYERLGMVKYRVRGWLPNT